MPDGETPAAATAAPKPKPKPKRQKIESLDHGHKQTKTPADSSAQAKSVPNTFLPCKKKVREERGSALLDQQPPHRCGALHDLLYKVRMKGQDIFFDDDASPAVLYFKEDDVFFGTAGYCLFLSNTTGCCVAGIVSDSAFLCGG